MCKTILAVREAFAQVLFLWWKNREDGRREAVGFFGGMSMLGQNKPSSFDDTTYQLATNAQLYQMEQILC